MPLDLPPPPSAYEMPANDFKFVGPTHLIIGGDMVDLSLEDGSVKFGPTYTPDEAARTFWSAVSSEYQNYLVWKQAQQK